MVSDVGDDDELPCCVSTKEDYEGSCCGSFYVWACCWAVAIIAVVIAFSWLFDHWIAAPVTSPYGDPSDDKLDGGESSSSSSGTGKGMSFPCVYEDWTRCNDAGVAATAADITLSANFTSRALRRWLRGAEEADAP